MKVVSGNYRHELVGVGGAVKRGLAGISGSVYRQIQTEIQIEITLSKSYCLMVKNC